MVSEPRTDWESSPSIVIGRDVIHMCQVLGAASDGVCHWPVRFGASTGLQMVTGTVADDEPGYVRGRKAKRDPRARVGTRQGR
jgi:hypothetical protein